jgi:LacI family transcriptional regulator
MRRVTLQDIAREAGVSRFAVSVALNDKPGVSDVLRERIKRIADRLGYQPNAIARSLSTRQSKTIGMIVKDIANPFYSEVTEAVEGFLYEKGFTLLLMSTGENHDKEVAAVRTMLGQQVAGLILVPLQQNVDLAHLRVLRSTHFPHVFISPPISELEGSYVYNDDYGGAVAAVQYLLARGYQRVGFATGPTTSASALERQRGYAHALGQAGIPTGRQWVLAGGATIEEGKALGRYLLSLLAHGAGGQQPPDALICYNDLLAIGALVELHRHGYEVPRDLALVGFDNIEVTEALNPPLTTVSVPRYDIGLRAVQLLFAHIADSQRPCSAVSLPTRLVMRSSA